MHYDDGVFFFNFLIFVEQKVEAFSKNDLNHCPSNYYYYTEFYGRAQKKVRDSPAV